MDKDKLLVMADIRDHWLFAQRNAKLIASVTAVFIILALVLALILPVRYEGTSIVMLDTRKTKVSSVEQVVSALPPDNSIVRSEMNVIKSRSVSDRVIDQLDLLHDPEFATSPSLFQKIRHILPGGDSEEEERKIKSQQRANAAIVLFKHLDVANDGRSYSIAISYRDHDPEKAAKIANAFADQYLVDQLEVKYEAMQRANGWLAKRMEGLRTEVTTAEKAVEDFKNAHNLEKIDNETVAQQQLEEINTKLSEAKVEYSQALARLNDAEKTGKANPESSMAVVSSPLIQQLKQQEAEVGRKVADLSTRYGDRHPTIINARNELGSIREKIKEEVDKITSGLSNGANIARAQVESLENQLDALRRETGVGNKDMVVLRQLEREAESSRSLYEGFLKRFKEISMQQDMQMADARIIARADPPAKPYFPNLVVFMLLGVIAGVISGFTAALLLEYLDRGFRTLDLIEKVYGVPGIGSTIAINLPPGQFVTDYVIEKPLSSYAESLRSIRTSLEFSNVDAPPRVIAVTSSTPGEGKSVFSVTFARVLAKSGAKVLLIDADMRRPRVHAMLGLDSEKPDLAMMLAHVAEFKSVVQKDTSGADVIIAHNRALNPHDLLASKQMENLLVKLRKEYDLIIIDTPPVMMVSDAAVIARLTDTMIFIVRWAITPREIVGQALKLLKGYNVKIAGVVLTQVDMESQKRYGYSEHYGDQYKSYYVD